MSKVLVTGGHGLIGAWTALRLASNGDDVTLFDTAPIAGSTAAGLGLADRPGVHVVHGDVRDADAFAMLGTSFDFIVHAAGILGIHRVVEEPLSTLDVNVRGTQVCLEFAATQRHLRRVILFSTSEIYGRDTGPSAETDPAVIDADSLRWGYAAGKLTAEFFGLAWHAKRGLPVVVVRPFNVYGPHAGPRNAISKLVGRALSGADLELSGDGAQRRTWCYVTDLVDGVLGCLTASCVGQVFNLGNDRTELSIHELAGLIVERTGSRSAIRLLGDSTPDVRNRRPDLTKARALLGYQPAVGLTEGIDRVVAACRRS